jgi:hypothetical protein
MPAHVGSRAGGVTRLQSSLHATARRIACPSPTRAFTPELSPAGSPPANVGYDYMAYSQLPWPDFHRLDTCPCGLRTKHTFISIALTKGLNLTFIAEYCGTSVAMIEQHYGRFLASRVDEQLRLLSGSSVATEPRRRVPKTATFGGGLQFWAEKPLQDKASLTVPSWNQIIGWLREMDLLRQAVAA